MKSFCRKEIGFFFFLPLSPQVWMIKKWHFSLFPNMFPYYVCPKLIEISCQSVLCSAPQYLWRGDGQSRMLDSGPSCILLLLNPSYLFSSSGELILARLVGAHQICCITPLLS